jgi:hypothetical protein
MIRGNVHVDGGAFHPDNSRFNAHSKYRRNTVALISSEANKNHKPMSRRFMDKPPSPKGRVSSADSMLLISCTDSFILYLLHNN